MAAIQIIILTRLILINSTSSIAQFVCTGGKSMHWYSALFLCPCNGKIIFFHSLSLTALRWFGIKGSRWGLGKVEEQGLQLIRLGYVPLYDILRRSSIVYYHLVNQCAQYLETCLPLYKKSLLWPMSWTPPCGAPRSTQGELPSEVSDYCMLGLGLLCICCMLLCLLLK